MPVQIICFDLKNSRTCQTLIIRTVWKNINVSRSLNMCNTNGLDVIIKIMPAELCYKT